MAKSTNLGELIKKIYDILQPIDEIERAKVLNAVRQLFGEPMLAAHDETGTTHKLPTGTAASRQPADQPSEKAFYVQKNPATKGGTALTKGEMLAIAARYREQHGGGEQHTREDFAAFFQAARENFDKNNFSRDIKNAQHQAKFFTKGGERGRYQLSYFGQQYVDALPERDAAKKLKAVGRKRAPRKQVRKK